MTKVLIASLLTGSLAAWLLILAKKWRILDWLQRHSPNDFFHELFTCDFCLSWWCSVIIVCVAAAVTGDALLLVVPFFSTMISRRLL
jgi:hypothetical protein